MTRSMTGFARNETHSAFGTLTWELRTVNHRYLDMSLRLPEELRALEPACRERVSAALRRGKLDGLLRFDPAAGSAPLAVDEARARAVAAAAAQVGKFLPGAAAIGPFDVLRWPGVVREPERDLEALGAEVLALLEAALVKLAEMRVREGARLAELLRERARQVSGIVAELRDRSDGLRARLNDKLRARFEELKLNVDAGRLEQELVLLLQRLDVAEELDRLDSHVRELDTALKGGEAVGRRLDFLMQEFNREANTLGSKAQDTDIIRHVVDLKVLIEQMREQVQNIE